METICSNNIDWRLQYRRKSKPSHVLPYIVLAVSSIMFLGTGSMFMSIVNSWGPYIPPEITNLPMVLFTCSMGMSLFSIISIITWALTASKNENCQIYKIGGCTLEQSRWVADEQRMLHSTFSIIPNTDNFSLWLATVEMLASIVLLPFAIMQTGFDVGKSINGAKYVLIGVGAFMILHFMHTLYTNEHESSFGGTRFNEGKICKINNMWVQIDVSDVLTMSQFPNPYRRQRENLCGKVLGAYSWKYFNIDNESIALKVLLHFYNLVLHIIFLPYWILRCLTWILQIDACLGCDWYNYDRSSNGGIRGVGAASNVVINPNNYPSASAPPSEEKGHGHDQVEINISEL